MTSLGRPSTSTHPSPYPAHTYSPLPSLRFPPFPSAGGQCAPLSPLSPFSVRSTECRADLGHLLQQGSLDVNLPVVDYQRQVSGRPGSTVLYMHSASLVAASSTHYCSASGAACELSPGQRQRPRGRWFAPGLPLCCLGCLIVCPLWCLWLCGVPQAPGLHPPRSQGRWGGEYPFSLPYLNVPRALVHRVPPPRPFLFFFFFFEGRALPRLKWCRQSLDPGCRVSSRSSALLVLALALTCGFSPPVCPLLSLPSASVCTPAASPYPCRCRCCGCRCWRRRRGGSHQGSGRDEGVFPEA